MEVAAITQISSSSSESTTFPLHQPSMAHLKISTLPPFWCPFRQRAPQHRRKNGTTFSHREIPGNSHRNFRNFFLNGKRPGIQTSFLCVNLMNYYSQNRSSVPLTSGLISLLFDFSNHFNNLLVG